MKFTDILKLAALLCILPRSCCCQPCEPIECGRPLISQPYFPYDLLRCHDGRQRVIECARKADGRCEWDIRTKCTGTKVYYIDGQSKPEQTVAGTLVAITITGQLSRVEIESKLNFFLRLESKNRFLTIYLFIVLSHAQSTIFRAEFNNKLSSLEPLMPLYAGNLTSLARAFAQHVAGIYTYSYDQEQILSRELPFDESSLFVRLMLANDRKRAMISHLGQWDGLTRAIGVIHRAELLLGRKFDFVVKLRDDDLFLLPFRLSALLNRLTRNDSRLADDTQADFFSSGCGMFGGVNDHLFFLRRSALAVAYGIGAMKAFFDGVIYHRRLISYRNNPEYLLLKALERHGITQRTLSPCDLPVVTVRRGWDEYGRSAKHMCVDQIIFEALLEDKCSEETFDVIAYRCRARRGFLATRDIESKNLTVCAIAERNTVK